MSLRTRFLIRTLVNMFAANDETRETAKRTVGNKSICLHCTVSVEIFLSIVMPQQYTV